MKRLLLLMMTVTLIITSAGCSHKEDPQEDPASSIWQTDLHPVCSSPLEKTAAIREKGGKKRESSDAPDYGNDSGEFSIELKTTGRLSYYLYTPAHPRNNMTLIIYLHGSGMRLAQTELLLTNEAFPLYLQRGDFANLQAYVAVPKLTEDYPDWSAAGEEISELIIILHDECAIDTGKVALTGHSLGGSGCWQLAIRLPDTFACIAPLSGGVACSESNLDALAKIRVWSFIGTADTVIDPDMSRQLISALQKRGADALISELVDATHRDLPLLAYRQSDLMNWLVRCGQ